MKHDLPEHLRDELAKMLAIYYAAGSLGPRPSSLSPDFQKHEAARIAEANKLWAKYADPYRYAINQTLAGEPQTIIP